MSVCPEQREFGIELWEKGLEEQGARQACPVHHDSQLSEKRSEMSLTTALQTSTPFALCVYVSQLQSLFFYLFSKVTDI